MSAPGTKGEPASPPAWSDAAATWDRRYGTDDYLFGVAPNAWLQRHADLFQAGQRALCVADGEGRNSVWLATRGLLVDAFDISAAGVDKARRLAEGQGVHVGFSVADVDQHAWPEGDCDVVVAIFVQFADPPMRTRMFERMRRALKPGGWLLLLGYTPAQLAHGTGGPGIESHLYTPELLRTAFHDLRIVELESFEDTLQEGSAHRGRSALIGLVARRPGPADEPSTQARADPSAARGPASRSRRKP